LITEAYINFPRTTATDAAGRVYVAPAPPGWVDVAGAWSGAA
jgi:hypothetical protein